MVHGSDGLFESLSQEGVGGGGGGGEGEGVGGRDVGETAEVLRRARNMTLRWVMGVVGGGEKGDG